MIAVGSGLLLVAGLVAFGGQAIGSPRNRVAAAPAAHVEPPSERSAPATAPLDDAVPTQVVGCPDPDACSGDDPGASPGGPPTPPVSDGSTAPPVATPPPALPPVPGVPPAGRTGTALPAQVVPEPGQVGFRGDPARLPVIDGSGPTPAGTRWQGGVLQASGDVLLDGVFVRGGIDYSGGGTLTIRNSVIEGAPPAMSPVLARSGRLDVRDSTVRWRPGAPPPGLPWGNGAVEGDATMTVLRNDLSGTPDGIQTEAGNSLIEQNWIHGLALLGTPPNNTHNDGIQSYGGPNLVIRYNRIDIRDAQGRAYDGLHQNGAVFVQPEGQPSTGLQVIGNFLVGGGFTFRLESPASGAIVTGNQFGPTTGGFGSVLVQNSSSIAQWSGNTDTAGRTLARP